MLVGVLRGPGSPAFEDMGPLARSVASAVALLAVMVVPDASAAATAARSNGAHVKGIGESSIATTAAAVGNALYAALGVQIHGLPIRAERVFRAMRGAATRPGR